MAGAIADDDGVAFLDRLKPEEIAADDVARLPDQEMIVRHRCELAGLRQDGGLNAARITQALQDQLVRRGGALLAFFKLGQVAIDGDAAGMLGAPLAHLDPAPVGTVLEHRLAGIAMLRQALLDKGLRTPPRILDETGLNRRAKNRLIGRAGLGRPFAVVEQLGIFVVAEHQAVLGIV